MRMPGAILLVVAFLCGYHNAGASCEQAPYPPLHDGGAPVPPPAASDSTFTCDVAGGPGEDNEWLDKQYRILNTDCNFKSDPHVIEHFKIIVTRNVGIKSSLYSNGLLQAKLIIYHKYTDKVDCFEKPYGYPCPKHVVSLNGHDVGILEGGTGWAKTELTIKDPTFINFANESGGVNTIDIHMDSEYWPANRNCYHIAMIDNITIAVTAPRPIVFVPGLGGSATGNFSNWISELDQRGVPENHTLSFPDAKLTQFYVEPIRSAIETTKSVFGVCRVGVVCYSKGGIDLRAYIKQHGSNSLDYVATVATPHAGYGGLTLVSQTPS